VPDLFLYIDSGVLGYLPRQIEKLNCPTAAYLIDVHLSSKLRQPIAALFDYVFVAQRDYAPAYQIGKRQHVEWLPLACDPELYSANSLPRIYDVGFVGHVGTTGRRAELLRALETRFRINDYRRPYTREEMAQVYSQSKIVVNCSVVDDVNMRVFEAMAAGALLITNRIGNGLLDLFHAGKHLITFENQAELVAHVAYYLEHPHERYSIADAGKTQVLTSHTYQHRADKIVQTIFADAPGARAPLRDAPPDRLLVHYAKIYSMLRLLDPCFEMLGTARRLGRSRLPVWVQLMAAWLRRIKYG
jgi:glycosyltransferase involved in cell wall biosynthesis